MIKVSVLVAVYNASPYLRKCLDSLLGQTLCDIQIICIDDCSTDDSLDILKEYALQDNRVEIIHLDANSGQAHARNIGLKNALGEYTCMLDADDWFSPDALEKAVESFDSETDAVLFDVIMSWPVRNERYPMPVFHAISGYDAFVKSLTWQIHGLYMIRTSLHKLYPYDETCKLYSDDNTTRLHYLFSRNVRCCAGIYYYRQHSASSTHAISVRRFDYLKANESMKNQLIQFNTAPNILSLYENHRWLNLIGVYMFYHCHASKLSSEERHYGINEIKRIWASIDRTMLNKKTIAKFGYRPMPSWLMFRIQEWLYFTLRGFLGKNT